MLATVGGGSGGTSTAGGGDVGETTAAGGRDGGVGETTAAGGGDGGRLVGFLALGDESAMSCVTSRGLGGDGEHGGDDEGLLATRSTHSGSLVCREAEAAARRRLLLRTGGGGGSRMTGFFERAMIVAIDSKLEGVIR
ncbi:glycine-rich protein 2-like [Cynara cardunculus var. scolymus]|uniref:glycine-rich protein 2-like n=1 Tax=Cynara cardunculus var. scolymus TaxID=59895 RepID=UPI000D62EB8B|nr:glycine-rich protein 2-like [Cynara cardunculus var. scolymus]